MFGVLALLLHPASAGDRMDAPAGGGPPLESLSRIVARWGFEDAERRPIDFPVQFTRIISEDRGFPRFGRIRLADDAAFEDRWSLRFELDGGSLAAGLPPGLLPVLPLADYEVSVRVRTEGLLHARARLAAMLHDVRGDPIAASRVESEPVRTEGAWTELSVIVPGVSADASDLVFELQVLQPQQLDPPAQDHARAPVLRDITGRAWFDDVVVRHVPRIQLRTSSEHGIIIAPDRPELLLRVNDLTGESLMASLRVDDLDGRVVHSISFPAPRGRQPARLDLPLTRQGWYHAILEIRSPQRIVGQRTLDFVILPPRSGRSLADPGELGVVLGAQPPAHFADLPDLVNRLGVGDAVINIWDGSTAHVFEGEGRDQLRDAIERMLAADLQLTFALTAVPGDIAQRLGIDTHNVLALLNAPDSVWRPFLDDVLVTFGLRIHRWQIGDGDRRLDATRLRNDRDADELVRNARTALQVFIPDPTIVRRFDADRQLPDATTGSGVQVVVPWHVRPAVLPDHAPAWLQTDPDALAIFDLLPDDLFTPRQRGLDLLFRGLYGWRAGLDRMAIRAPWRWPAGDSDGVMSPGPALAIWRGLGDALRGRRFIGELDLGDHVRCWLMQSDSPGRDALVMWRDQSPGTEPGAVRLVLADGAIRAVDPFGNARRIDPIDGIHTVPVDDMPVFVEGIDLALARFRAGFRIEPRFIRSFHRVHERSIVLTNPFENGISGELWLAPPPDCDMTPRRHEFIIPPGGEVRLPLRIILDRSAIAGPKRIDARIELIAGAEHQITTHATIEIGWEDIEARAMWRVAPNRETGREDLVITQFITNHGDEPVHLSAFMRAPSVGHQQRLIGVLQPGSTAVKTFHIPDGASLLAGRDILIGVSERDGIARLNHRLTIPAFIGSDATQRRADADASPIP
jgi:hypothetical protein